MDQIGIQVSELDLFMEEYLTGPGRASKDINILNAFNDLFLHVQEYELMEKVQIYFISLMRQMGESHEKSLEVALKRMCNIYISLKEYPKALQFANEALAISDKYHGSESIEVAKHLINIGRLFHCQFNLEESLKYYEKGLDIYSKLLKFDNKELLGLKLKVIFILK